MSMGVIVGSSSSFVECNACHNKTEKVYGSDSGQRAAKNAVEYQWHISLVTGDAKCPQCQQKELERARKAL